MKYVITYIIILFTVLTLYACIGEETPIDNPSDKKAEMYLTLSLNRPEDTLTRTAGDETEEHEAGESGISNAKIILVGNGHTIFEVFNDDIEWESNKGTYTTQPIPLNIPVGTYYLYMIANAAHQDGTTPFPTTMTYDNITSIYTLNPTGQAGMDKLSTANYFMMANVQNNLSEDDCYGGVEIIVRQGEHTTIDDPLSVHVNLERLACKVTASLSENIKPAILNTKLIASGNSDYVIDAVTLDGIGLVNCVNQYHLIQQWEEGTGFTTPEDRNMQLVTPSYSLSYSLDDGYYNRISEYISGKSLFKTKKTPLYCLENNSPYYDKLTKNDQIAAPGTKMKGRVTGVLFRIKAVITREHSSNEDIIEDDQDPGIWTKAAPVVRTFYRYEGGLYADIPILVSENPSLSGKTTTMELRDAGVEVYENGYMYYIYWIKDKNYTNDGKTYYAVIRNTLYELTITNIKAIGNDIPGGNDYDETDPIDYLHTDIDVTLKNSGWDLHEYWHIIR